MKYSRLSKYKIKKIMKYFSEDITASSTSILLGININTINSYYNKFRELLLYYSLRITGKEFGEFELDKSYFGAKWITGKQSIDAAGKTPVFDLLKRGGQIYITIIPNCSKEELIPITQGKIIEGSTIHTDS